MSTSDIPPLNGRFLSEYDRNFGPGRTRRARRQLDLQATAPAAVRPELILGESSLLPFHFLRAGDHRGRAVVKIVRADGACGTGFLVAPDILLTNHHVLPDVATASEARAVGNHEGEPPEGVAAVVAVTVPLAPEVLFVTQDELDYTFCAVPGLEHLGIVPMDRDARSIGTSDVVNIIQHPRGRPKEVAMRDNQVVKADRVVLHYVCDTEPGSSGSPVFDNGWRLVALHHASIAADGPIGGRAARGQATDARFLNEGVRLSAIALSLEAVEGVTGADPATLARLRGLFRDLDPFAGFFGALGRETCGRSAVEIVSEIDKRRGDTLDIGFWDLRDAADRLPEGIADLGWAMAAMGLDIWCLAHISSAQARALAEHLDSHFRLEYRELSPPGRDSLAVAVLARKSRAISAERVEEAGLDVLRVKVRDIAHRVSTLRILPMPSGVPSSSERGTLVAAISRDSSGDSLLIGGAAFRPIDSDALRAAGLSLTRTDAGLDGGFALLRAAGSSVTRLFTSPNLAPDDALQVVHDRTLPEHASHLTARRPIAARLVLGVREPS